MPSRLNVVLNVSNVEKSMAWWKSLGFPVTTESFDEASYALVNVDTGHVILFPKDLPTSFAASREWLSPPLGNGVVVALETTGFDRMHETARRSGAELEADVQTLPTGQRILFLVDPDGYSIQFSEPMTPLRRAGAAGNKGRAAKAAKRGRGQAKRTLKARRAPAKGARKGGAKKAAKKSGKRRR